MSSSVGMIIPLPKKIWKVIQNSMVPVTTKQFFPVGQVAKMTGHPKERNGFRIFFFMATFDFFRGFLPMAIF